MPHESVHQGAHGTPSPRRRKLSGGRGHQRGIYATDDVLVLQAFPDYFGGRPANDGLRLRILPDEVMRGLELRKGTLDLVVNDGTAALGHQAADIVLCFLQRALAVAASMSSCSTPAASRAAAMSSGRTPRIAKGTSAPRPTTIATARVALTAFPPPRRRGASPRRRASPSAASPASRVPPPRDPVPRCNRSSRSG